MPDDAGRTQFFYAAAVRRRSAKIRDESRRRENAHGVQVRAWCACSSKPAAAMPRLKNGKVCAVTKGKQVQSA